MAMTPEQQAKYMRTLHATEAAVMQVLAEMIVHRGLNLVSTPTILAACLINMVTSLVTGIELKQALTNITQADLDLLIAFRRSYVEFIDGAREEGLKRLDEQIAQLMGDGLKPSADADRISNVSTTDRALSVSELQRMFRGSRPS